MPFICLVPSVEPGAQRALGSDLGSTPIPAAVRAEPELTALHGGGHTAGCRLTAVIGSGCPRLWAKGAEA